jgi:hypothetical protein
LNGVPLIEYDETKASQLVNEEARLDRNEYEDLQAALCLMELPYLWVSTAGRQKEDSDRAEAEEELDRWNRIERNAEETSKRLGNLEKDIRQLTRGVTTLLGTASATRASTTGASLEKRKTKQ